MTLIVNGMDRTLEQVPYVGSFRIYSEGVLVCDIAIEQAKCGVLLKDNTIIKS